MTVNEMDEVLYNPAMLFHKLDSIAFADVISYTLLATIFNWLLIHFIHETNPSLVATLVSN